jgi:hypothetical protein
MKYMLLQTERGTPCADKSRVQLAINGFRIHHMSLILLEFALVSNAVAAGCLNLNLDFSFLISILG